MTEATDLKSYLDQAQQTFRALMNQLRSQLPAQVDLANVAEAKLGFLMETLAQDLNYNGAFQIWELRSAYQEAQAKIEQLTKVADDHQEVLATLEDRRIGDLDRLAVIQEELSRARAELLKSIDRESSLQAQLTEAKIQIAEATPVSTSDLTGKILELTSQIEEQQQEQNALHLQLAAKAQQIEALELGAQQSQEYIKISATNSARLQEKEAQSQVQQAELQAQVDLLTTKLAEQAQELTLLQGQVGDHTNAQEQEIQSLQSHLREYNEQVDILQAHLIEESNRLAAANKQLNFSAQQVQELEHQLTLAAEREALLEAQLALKEQAQQRLEEKLRTLSQEYLAVQQQLTQTAETFTEVVVEPAAQLNHMLEARLDSLEQEFATRLLSLELQNRKWEEEITLLKNALQSDSHIRQATIRELLEEAGLDPEHLE